ncbi:glycine betaine ABC transporter substrate-binding protein [Alicyclobacillus dauci]|uniref:Glycine betaine ABC transporter substrate-binding protein n=1 Tax=Alicyclobacillus dauci TaxID=1475485 RepID=A0ABY6Z4Q7_9BACL|nr:glycine betaine ABC transporter substrate-binding protein [Alicyclobacillus dauci]WAH37830.1 glycine betaine ABC transporter substrate-binding protein [Alicyclobacillus dauci]
MRHQMAMSASVMILAGLVVTGCGTANDTSPAGNHASTNSAAGTAGTQNKSQAITIGYMNWDEDVAASYLWKYLLEQKGYQVDMKLLSPGPVWEGLYTGDLDVFFDSWMPYVDKDYEAKYGSRITTINRWYGGVTQEGFAVPDYVPVKTVDQLRAYADKTNGQIIGIEAGSTEMGQAKQALTTYNLPYQIVSSSTPGMLTELQKAVQAKQPIIVTLWSPHWAFAKYNLHYVEDPKGVFGKQGYVETVANKTWAGNNATVVNWLKNFHLSEQQLGTLEEDVAGQSDDPSKGVTEWVTANQDVVDKWLK